MLPTAVKRLALAPWARAFWARALAVVLLFVTTPGSVELVQEVVSFATGIECCAEDGCDESTEDCCPRSCMHRLSCAAVPTARELTAFSGGSSSDVAPGHGDARVERPSWPRRRSRCCRLLASPFERGTARRLHALLRRERWQERAP